MPNRYPPVDDQSVRDQVGKAARYLQSLLTRNEYTVVRGELLVLGVIAAPVVLQLSRLLTEQEIEDLTEQLCNAVVRDGKRYKSRQCLAQLSSLFTSLSEFQHHREPDTA